MIEPSGGLDVREVDGPGRVAAKFRLAVTLRGFLGDAVGDDGLGRGGERKAEKNGGEQRHSAGHGVYNSDRCTTHLQRGTESAGEK